MDREPSSAGILQVVSGDGSFNAAGVDKFVKDTGVESCGVGYTVVAIMGPQSSGKSTLLNHLVRGAGGQGWQRRTGSGGSAGVLLLPSGSQQQRPGPINHNHCRQSPHTCPPSLAPASRRWTR